MTPSERRADLRRLLGGRWGDDGPPKPPRAVDRAVDAHLGGVLETLTLVGGPQPVPALYLRPDRGEGPWPAVLYCHAHGGRHPIGKSELVRGRPALRSGPWGPALAAAGIAALCLDMPCFEDRPADEAALAQARLWVGATLFGDMLADLALGLSWLADRPEIDSTRIAVVGLSMGATHAAWLAALDTRVAAAVALYALAELGPLIESGAHALHGPYMTVPGLLAAHTVADVVALAAPRPLFVAAGAKDPLTPRAALEPLLAALPRHWPEGGLQMRLEPDVGHWETPATRIAALAFVRSALGVD